MLLFLLLFFFFNKKRDDISLFLGEQHVVMLSYNAFNVYCRELAPRTVSLTGDRAKGDDSKH